MYKGQGHQRVFHFLYHERTPIDTDTLVSLISDKILWGKTIEVTGVTRNENTLIIKYNKRISVPFGKFTIGDTDIELLRKRDIDKKIIEQTKANTKWPSKWDKL